MEYAIHLQRDRRNLTDADIFACVKALDRRCAHGGDRRSENFKPSIDGMKTTGRSAGAKRTAEIVGTSSTKVERARMVLDHADEDTKDAVLRGEKSISAARTETMAKRRAEAQKPKPSDKPVFNLYSQSSRCHEIGKGVNYLDASGDRPPLMPGSTFSA